MTTLLLLYARFRCGIIGALVMIIFLSRPAWASPWTVELTQNAGFLLRYDSAIVVRANYVAWGPNWKYVPVQTQIGPNQKNQWTIQGRIPDFHTQISGKILQTDSRLTYEYNLLSERDLQNNIGGGIRFEIRMDSQIFGPEVPKPELIDSGWSWTPKPGETFRVVFTPPTIKPFFEKNKPSEIRAFFIPPNISAGQQQVTMHLDLPPGTIRVDGASKRYAQDSDSSWRSETVDWTTTPVDLSYLNHQPAGSKGFVQAEGDRLVFEDGSEARFWGANIQAYALFNASNQMIEQQARRIARLGFNLVRIHHHDSADWSPNLFVPNADNTSELDEKNLDRIDYWVKCLKDNGVYVWLDLHVGRPFRTGDQIEAFEELKSGKTGRQAKGLNYVNLSVTQRMKDFARAYLTHTNPYTKTRYVDEPAVMGILITNENDITHHFGNLFLPDKSLPVHRQWYETLRDRITKDLNLDRSEVWRTWEPGPSKIVLNWIEYQWSVDFVQFLRSIGVKVPIATTNTWGNNPLFSLPSLMAGDVIDVHAYGQAESLSSNPRYDDMSSHWIAAAQVLGKPLVITEWNTEYPHRDRFTQPLFMAAHACFQGWDAPMIYGYHQAPLVVPSRLYAWGISNDPAMVSLMPAAALLYRRQDVKQAEKTVIFAPGTALLFKNISPANSPALRTIAERHRLVIGLPKTPYLPWIQGVHEDTVSDPSQPTDGIGEDSITSDTGELVRNWSQGVFTINSPRTQAVMGWMKDHEYRLNDISIRISTPKATVVVTSLDDQPISSSKRMLLTATAQAEMKGKPPKVMAELVKGEVDFAQPVRYQPLTPQGIPRMSPIPGPVRLSPEADTHWYLVTRE